MPTTTEITSIHQTKINQRIEAYISEYLNLCESEIERLFISGLLYQYFENKYSFGFSSETDFDRYLFSFSELQPVYISSNDKGFGKFMLLLL